MAASTSIAIPWSPAPASRCPTGSGGAKGAVCHVPRGSRRTHYVPRGRRGGDRRHGADGGLLADGRLRVGKALLQAVAVQRPTREERAGAPRTRPTPSGWPTWPLTTWCGPPSCPRPRPGRRSSPDRRRAGPRGRCRDAQGSDEKQARSPGYCPRGPLQRSGCSTRSRGSRR